MGVRQIERFLEQWRMDARDLHRRLILAPTPRERERWHAIWLLAQGWTASGTAQALGRDLHTIGRWAAAFGEGGPAALMFEQSGGSPRPMRGAAGGVEGGGAGTACHGWHRTGQLEGGPSVCLGAIRHQPEPQWLPELSASVGVRPEASQEAIGQGRQKEARRFGAKIFFADEAHFRADAGLRGKWVLRGEPALVDLTSPRYGEKASYYSAVCLETGEVEWMELEGNSNSGTSAAFLEQLRERHTGQLNVTWDNAPAPPREAQEWRGSAGISQDARTLELRLVNPRFHEGRLCRATARTSTGMRRSGAGRGRRPPAICAWEAGPRCRRGSAASSPVWPAGAARSNGAAIEGRSAPDRFPARFPASGKCTSHLGLGLDLPTASTTTRLAWVRGTCPNRGVATECSGQHDEAGQRLHNLRRPSDNVARRRVDRIEWATKYKVTSVTSRLSRTIAK